MFDIAAPYTAIVGAIVVDNSILNTATVGANMIDTTVRNTKYARQWHVLSFRITLSNQTPKDNISEMKHVQSNRQFILSIDSCLSLLNKLRRT